jgi:hypothetical protein
VYLILKVQFPLSRLRSRLAPTFCNFGHRNIQNTTRYTALERIDLRAFGGIYESSQMNGEAPIIQQVRGSIWEA